MLTSHGASIGGTSLCGCTTISEAACVRVRPNRLPLSALWHGAVHPGDCFGAPGNIQYTFLFTSEMRLVSNISGIYESHIVLSSIRWVDLLTVMLLGWPDLTTHTNCDQMLFSDYQSITLSHIMTHDIMTCWAVTLWHMRGLFCFRATA